MKLLAQAKLGTLQGLGTLGTITDTSSAFTKFINVFSTALGVLTISGGIWFVIQILIGAFQWLASGGEKQALQNAQKRLSNAILGLFVVVFSYALISIVGLIFGINILEPFKWLGFTSISNSVYQYTPPVTCAIGNTYGTMINGVCVP